LPKISLNEWYAGNHWTKRKAIKDQYYWIIKSQFKAILSKGSIYQVDYSFIFKSKPLDASNTIAMVKMIEDIIFEDDSYKIIDKITISSKKGTEDIVNIKILIL
jgi:hypothetical protein